MPVLGLQIVLGLVAIPIIWFTLGGGVGATARRVVRCVSIVFLAHVALTLAVIFLRDDHELYATPLRHDFAVKYGLLFVVIVLGVTFVMALAIGRVRVEVEETVWSWRDFVFMILGALILGVAGFAYFLPRWFSTYFGTLTADQFLFLLTQGNGESTTDVANQIQHYMVIPIVLSLVVGAMLGLWRSRLVLSRASDRPAWWLSANRTRLVAVGVSLILLVASLVRAFTVLPLADLADARTPSSFIEDEYVEPTPQNVVFPEKKRNLVHIYMESVENSYYDKAEGGYMDLNLMPDLAQLTKENVSFSNTESFGGPHQTPGSEHSIAAIHNFWAGIPLKTDAMPGQEKNAYPSFTTMGDILAAEGYRNEWLMGADADWGHLDNYFTEHGRFKILDHARAIADGLIPKDYSVWWGYEDDKLYEFAKTEARALADSGEPFYLVVENADTHFPDGYASPNMTEKPFDSQYGNVIHYSQKQVVEFVRWIQQQDFYEDTTIVITGDHRSMDPKFFAGWDTSYERTVANVIINGVPGDPGRERTTNRQYAPFDFFPTILTSIGADLTEHRLGLGTDLYSDEPTLVEKYGLGEVEKSLNRYSQFYEDHTEQAFRPAS